LRPDNVHAVIRVTLDQSPVGLADFYADVAAQLAAVDSRTGAFAALSTLAVECVSGAEHAGITRLRDRRLSTAGASSELPAQVDQLQYELDDGPCLDALSEGAVFRTGNLAGDTRWPVFGRLAAERTGVQSMLAVRVYAEEDPDERASLNMYSLQPDAFTDTDIVVATLLASHGALALLAASARERANNLQIALSTNREIGIAIGVLMNQHKITREQAFDLLRMASQNTHRKIADVAHDVADTGELSLPRRSTRPTPAD
jgi:hypothetical protein